MNQIKFKKRLIPLIMSIDQPMVYGFYLRDKPNTKTITSFIFWQLKRLWKSINKIFLNFNLNFLSEFYALTNIVLALFQTINKIFTQFGYI